MVYAYLTVLFYFRLQICMTHCEEFVIRILFYHIHMVYNGTEQWYYTTPKLLSLPNL